MRNGILLLIGMCFASSATFAQNNDSLQLRQIVNETMRNSGAYENLRYLSKDVGHRLSGSAGAEKAVKATAEMLRKAGADTVYLQPAMVTHWVRGGEEKGEVSANGQTRKLKLLSLGNSEGSGPKGIKGEVVVVNSLDEVHQLGAAVKGKIVLYNIVMDPTHIATFRAYGQSGGGRRSGASVAAKYGAIGVMVRSLASNPDDHPHTGTLQYNDSFPKIPAVAISTNDANWIAAQKGKITASITNHAHLIGEVQSYNVIGEIRGSEFPDEIITVGGHLDSWDVGEGANDDGSGCVQSIEVLRTFTANGIKPKRTIRAVMFMNEENGLGGGQAYLDSAVSKKENHLFAVESDAGGFTPRGFGFSSPDTSIKNRLMSYAPKFKEYYADNFYVGGGGADIGPLRKINTTLAGLSPDSQRYFDIHHAETDVFENVSKRELDLGAGVMAALIYLVDKYGLK